MNYQSGVFHSDHTFAKGGSAGGQGASEPGGPGLVFLNGAAPLNRNLRIDNKGQVAKVLPVYGTLSLFLDPEGIFCQVFCHVSSLLKDSDLFLSL